VTPSANGYSFSPASRSLTSVGADQSAQDFAATLQSASAPMFFVHVDHLNTPRMIADAAGTTVWKWDQQEPFGNNVADENPSGPGSFEFPMRFPGQYFDKETNLAYNYFRTFDASLGRYTRSDPLGLRGGLNTYAYVNGTPLRHIDPLGLAIQCIWTRRGRICTGTPDPAGGTSGTSGGDKPEMAVIPGGRDRPTERPERQTGTQSGDGNNCMCKFRGEAEVMWAPPAEPGYQDLTPYGTTGYEMLRCWYWCPGPGKKGYGYVDRIWGGGNFNPEELARFCAPEVPDAQVTLYRP
jgi:RHS repeat-associated protein